MAFALLLALTLGTGVAAAADGTPACTVAPTVSELPIGETPANAVVSDVHCLEF